MQIGSYNVTAARRHRARTAEGRFSCNVLLDFADTVGVEARLFIVDGNGQDIQVQDRHATLAYTFTVETWFVYRATKGSTVLFWQVCVCARARILWCVKLHSKRLQDWGT